MTDAGAPYDAFVLRAPLLPGSRYVEWAAEGVGGDFHGTRLKKFFAVREAFEDPVLKEALWLSSPSLAADVSRWTGRADSDLSTAVPASRYFVRLCTRPTPFGAMATVSLGRVGTHQCLELSPPATVQKHVALSYEFADCMSRRAETPTLFLLSPTAYEVADEVRFYDWSASGDTVRVMTAPRPEARLISRIAAGGPAPLSVLVERLLSHGLAADAAAELVLEAYDAGLLVDGTRAQLDPSFIASVELRPELGRARQLLEEYRAAPLGAGQETLRSLETELRRAAGGGDRRLLNVNLERVVPGLSITRQTADRALHVGEQLARLMHANRPRTAMVEFADRFHRRYGEDVEVDLLASIDADFGIPYDGLIPPNEPGISADIIELLADCWRMGNRTLCLEARDVDRLSPEGPAATDGFAVVASLTAHGVAQIRSVLGPPASSWLGRTSSFSPDVKGFVDVIHDREESHSAAVHAEIGFMPGPRAGDIVLRPLARTFELPINARWDLDGSRSIWPSDLTLRMSGGQLKLRSKKLDRDVLPRLAVAHNTSVSATPLYHLLCGIAETSGYATTTWSWGQLRFAQFLPRVELEGIAVSPAQWVVPPDVFNNTIDHAHEAFQTFCETQHVPWLVSFGRGDRRLAMVTADPASFTLFYDEVRRARCEPRVAEIPHFSGQPMSGGNLDFHEAIIPCAPQAAAADVNEARPTLAANAIARPTVSYFRVFGGGLPLDQLLQRTADWYEDERESHPSLKWFFIRYAADGYHVRFRFVGSSASVAEASAAFLASVQKLVDSGRVGRVEIDKYHPEYRRYGGEIGMLLSEQVFAADTTFCLTVLEMLKNSPSSILAQNRRWLGAATLDSFLGATDLTIAERIALLQAAESGIQSAMPGNDGARNARKEVRDQRPTIERVIELFRERVLQDPRVLPSMSSLGDSIQALRDQEGDCDFPFIRILVSLVHMHLNRLGITFVPADELAVYIALERFYARQMRQPAQR